MKKLLLFFALILVLSVSVFAVEITDDYVIWDFTNGVDELGDGTFGADGGATQDANGIYAGAGYSWGIGIGDVDAYAAIGEEINLANYGAIVVEYELLGNATVDWTHTYQGFRYSFNAVDNASYYTDGHGWERLVTNFDHTASYFDVSKQLTQLGENDWSQFYFSTFGFEFADPATDKLVIKKVGLYKDIDFYRFMATGQADAESPAFYEFDFTDSAMADWRTGLAWGGAAVATTYDAEKGLVFAGNYIELAGTSTTKAIAQAYPFIYLEYQPNGSGEFRMDWRFTGGAGYQQSTDGGHSAAFQVLNYTFAEENRAYPINNLQPQCYGGGYESLKKVVLFKTEAARAQYVAGVELVSLGAQKRVSGADGLRFGAKVNFTSAVADLAAVQYNGAGDTAYAGFLVIPTEMLDGAALDINNMDAAFVPAANIYASDANGATFTAVVTDIPVEAEGVELTAVPFISVGGTVYYGEAITRTYAAAE